PPRARPGRWALPAASSRRLGSAPPCSGGRSSICRARSTRDEAPGTGEPPWRVARPRSRRKHLVGHVLDGRVARPHPGGRRTEKQRLEGQEQKHERPPSVREDRLRHVRRGVAQPAIVGPWAVEAEVPRRSEAEAAGAKAA